MSEYRFRFWIESVLSALTGFLAVLTLFWRDWIEATTGFDPDHHNGAFEWVIVATLALVALGLAQLARSERRHRVAAA